MFWRGAPPRWWGLLLGSILLALALAWPRSLRQVYWLWMRVGETLGWLNTRIILGILFYGMFTPVGLFMRIRHKDLLRCTLVPDADTYRIVRQPRPASHMTHQF
jgi:hypothetical protein